MESTVAAIEDKVDELLVVLDRDIRHLRETLSWLDELRSLVVRRDEKALGRLLDTIRAESDGYSDNGAARRRIREELAFALGCSVDEVTLSRLETALPPTKRAELISRKKLLRSLTRQLKSEHLKTMMLLSDCARFNSALLKGILELGRTGAITYASDGAARSQTDTAFVNLQF